MKCRYPILLRDDKNRQYYVPCGKCAWCRKRIRDEWFFRFKNETKDSLFNRFVTFTYSEEFLPSKVNEETGEIMLGVVNKMDVQRFVKSMRNDGYKFRYFIASEYGKKGTIRPHYHGLFFSNEKIPFKEYWNNGFVVDLPAKDGSFKYITKYCLKGSNVPDGYPDNFRLMSRRPGIGSNFVYKGEPYILTPGGLKVVPGHFYKRKYLNSLNDKLRASVVDQNIDYLTSLDMHSQLLAEYNRSGQDISFEEWLDYKYKKDLKQQLKINSK